jgi:hypothetical protein
VGQWEERKRERVSVLCTFAKKKKAKPGVCNKNDSFFIPFFSPSLSSSDAPLYTRSPLSSRRLWAMQGELERHHQLLDSSFESSTANPLFEGCQNSMGACSASNESPVLQPSRTSF